MSRIVFIHGRLGSHRTCTEGPDGRACQICRDAANRYQQKRRDILRRRLEADPSIKPHGVAATYTNWGCRCDPCREAAGEMRRRYPPYQQGRPARSKPFGREWLNDNPGA